MASRATAEENVDGVIAQNQPAPIAGGARPASGGTNGQAQNQVPEVIDLDGDDGDGAAANPTPAPPPKVELKHSGCKVTKGKEIAGIQMQFARIFIRCAAQFEDNYQNVNCEEDLKEIAKTIRLQTSKSALDGLMKGKARRVLRDAQNKAQTILNRAVTVVNASWTVALWENADTDWFKPAEAVKNKLEEEKKLLENLICDFGDQLGSIS